jgi:hypothetical protein
MSTARYYNAEKNPHGAILPGVPLGDIDQQTFDGYPAWLQQSIDASPMYRKSRPPADKSQVAEPAPPPAGDGE